jgi:tetratricopeptide (TPR) repeat protein
MAELDGAVQVEYTVERATVFRHGQRLVAHGRYAQHYTTAQLDDAVQACAAQIAETVRRAGRHLAENPADIRACLAGAAALEEAGDIVEAERLYRHAVAMVPILREAHYHLARLAFRRGDLAAALDRLHPATTEETGDGRPFYLLARLHDRRREPVAAVWALEQAVARDPDNPLYAFELERLREKAGGARPGESLHGAKNASGKDNAPRDATGTLGADDATPALAASCTEPTPMPHAYGARPGLPGPDSDPMLVAAARDGVAMGAYQALRNAAAQSRASLDDLLDEAPGDGLPLLGLAVANGWEQPVVSPLHVPVDSAAAAASLPLTAAHMLDVWPQCAARPRNALGVPTGANEGVTHRPARDVERS